VARVLTSKKKKSQPPWPSLVNQSPQTFRKPTVHSYCPPRTNACQIWWNHPCGESCMASLHVPVGCTYASPYRFAPVNQRQKLLLSSKLIDSGGHLWLMFQHKFSKKCCVMRMRIQTQQNTQSSMRNEMESNQCLLASPAIWKETWRVPLPLLRIQLHLRPRSNTGINIYGHSYIHVQYVYAHLNILRSGAELQAYRV
jgi:hypothetical protein